MNGGGNNERTILDTLGSRDCRCCRRLLSLVFRNKPTGTTPTCSSTDEDDGRVATILRAKDKALPCPGTIQSTSETSPLMCLHLLAKLNFGI